MVLKLAGSMIASDGDCDEALGLASNPSPLGYPPVIKHGNGKWTIYQ